MNNQYFNIKDTLWDITYEYKEAIDLLEGIGFKNIRDEKQRENMGKSISLEMALKMKKVNVDTFSEQLIEKIEQNQKNVDTSLKDQKSSHQEAIKIKGILPCPVKMPLIDALEEFLNENQQKNKNQVDYDLKAASMGVDWMKESLSSKEVNDLPDLCISAGFDLFFDEKFIGDSTKAQAFEDFTGIKQYNEDFENQAIQLRDPKGIYSMVGVVPAVFLVNQEELGHRKMPKSWKDLLQEEFKNTVSLPIGDLDLFNAILLNIHKTYGEEGVKRLGQSLFKSMHPSEMVKSHIKTNKKPIVTIMPYFFTKMIKKDGPMKAIWPEEGAIISPIFMISKKNEKERLKPIVEFFASKKVGEILSHKGRFPSVHPHVDNGIKKDQKYMWLGWEYIYEHHISHVLDKCQKLFHGNKKEGKQ